MCGLSLNKADFKRKEKKNTGGFPGGPMVKNPPAISRNMGSIPDLGKSHIEKKINGKKLGGKEPKTRAGVISRGSRIGKSSPRRQKSVMGPQEGAHDWKEVLGAFWRWSEASFLICIYLALLGLSCHMQDLRSSLKHVGSSPPTRD